jgi:hypothetical protein
LPDEWEETAKPIMAMYIETTDKPTMAIDIEIAVNVAADKAALVKIYPTSRHMTATDIEISLEILSAIIAAGIQTHRAEGHNHDEDLMVWAEAHLSRRGANGSYEHLVGRAVVKKHHAVETTSVETIVGSYLPNRYLDTTRQNLLRRMGPRASQCTRREVRSSRYKKRELRASRR